jgi:hypothetical protein
MLLRLNDRLISSSTESGLILLVERNEDLGSILGIECLFSLSDSDNDVWLYRLGLGPAGIISALLWV